MQIQISTPRNFNFQRTVLSHGWCVLPPFEFDREKWTLTRVIDLARAQPITITVSAGKRALAVELSRAAGKRAVEKIARDVRHMFRLDDNMNTFYADVSSDAEFSWIANEGAGRLLRSPTVFEDLVKMMCTTNCSWALTEKMVSGLVQNLGREADDGRRSFPDAAAMAEMPLKFFVDEVRAGYRAPYLKELAGRVGSGELNVEEWVCSGIARR